LLLITTSSSFHAVAQALHASSKQLFMRIDTTKYMVTVVNQELGIYRATAKGHTFQFHVIDGYIRSTDKTITASLPEIQFYTGE
jgi:hypothetical protein